MHTYIKQVFWFNRPAAGTQLEKVVAAEKKEETASAHKEAKKNTGGSIAADVMMEPHGLGLMKQVLYKVPFQPE